jgi:DNA-binding transcriptional MerR regulator
MEAAQGMQLKVGELARSTGLTVRTLHHYDEIGLLKPSGRSESGYRLYSQADVARLHAIQALRHLGMSLNDIAAVLEGRGPAPEMILTQQIRGLDTEIARANDLRGRLALMRDKLAQGGEPTLQDWLELLSEMATYGKYFNTDEIKALFAGWRRVQDEWQVLVQDVQGAMDQQLDARAPEVQPLARRWMSLMLCWMDSNFGLIERWDRMYNAEPAIRMGKGAPPPAMVVYIRQAIDARMELLRRHFTLEEMARFRHVPERDWQQVDEAGRKLLEAGAPAGSEAARALARQWLGLMDQLTSGDVALRDKTLRAGLAEPMLRAGTPLSMPVRRLLLDTLRQDLTLT